MIKLELKSLKGKKKFDEFFKTASKFYLNDAAIFVTYKDDAAGSNDATLEYAVAVRKKDARKAVVRNRIKRLLRECIRQLANNSETAGKLMRFDRFIIIWANAPKHPKLIGLNQVCPVVEKLIDKALKFTNNR
jgi:ribonuclease P protein component